MKLPGQCDDLLVNKPTLTDVLHHLTEIFERQSPVRSQFVELHSGGELLHFGHDAVNVGHRKLNTAQHVLALYTRITFAANKSGEQVSNVLWIIHGSPLLLGRDVRKSS